MHHHHHRGSKSWQPASVNEDINLFLTTLIFSICLYPNSQTPSKWRNNGILCLDIFNWSPGFFTFSFIHSRVGLQQKLELDAEQSRDTTVDSRQQAAGRGRKMDGMISDKASDGHHVTPSRCVRLSRGKCDRDVTQLHSCLVPLSSTSFYN